MQEYIYVYIYIYTLALCLYTPHLVTPNHPMIVLLFHSGGKWQKLKGKKKAEKNSTKTVKLIN